MDPHIKMRYNFALSSFARRYGVSKLSKEMTEFCLEWALGEEIAPLDCLNHVDHYFGQLWQSK